MSGGDWVVLQGQALRDLRAYLRDHDGDPRLDVLHVTVLGQLPREHCNHNKLYLEMQDALQHQNDARIARNRCSCGVAITLTRATGPNGWIRS